MFKDYWDTQHNKYATDNIAYDYWLDKFLPQIKSDSKILELGCGLGNNTKYLTERGFNVLATDYSDVALEKVNQYIPKAQTMNVDLTKKFPFQNSSFDIIVADLCLHYFDDAATKGVMKEIKRVLKPSGMLLARVNTTKDFNHGAGQGIKLEDNYFFVEGYNKRFFDKQSVLKYFGIIGNTEYFDAQMTRYSKPKDTFEIVTYCNKNIKENDYNAV